MKTHSSPPSPSNSEWLTRKRLIDSMLKASGWKVAPYVEGRPLTAQDRYAIEEYPTGVGPADYALCTNGQIIGIVEAKKLTLGPQNVLSQAERYSLEDVIRECVRSQYWLRERCIEDRRKIKSPNLRST